MNADVRVPPGFAVTTDFYDEYLARTGLDGFIEERLDDDLSNIDAASEVSADIQQRIRDEPFPAELDAAIEDDGEDKRFYILQSRPETSWSRSEDDEDAEETASDSAASTILENISKSDDGAG